MEIDGSNPLTVYLTLALSAITTLVLISAKLRELLAPILRWFGGGSRTLRKMQQCDEVEDARVADLTRQVMHLASRVTALESDAAAHRQMVMEHATWDVYAIVEAGKAGVTLTPPPTLLTHRISREA